MIALAAVAAAPASASAAPLVDPVSASRSVSVPSGASRSTTLTCPGTAVALHGATTDDPAGHSVPRSDPQRWTFRFSGGAADRRVRAVLRCVRLRLPAGVSGVRLRVGTVRLPGLDVASRATRRVSLRCQRGLVPTGWGVAHGGPARGLAVVAAVPTRRGFVFELRNRGGSAVTVTPRIRCLDRTERADDGRRHSFRTRVASFRDTGSSARHRCRRGEYSLAAGVSLDNVFLELARPVGARGGRWSFSGGEIARTSLICLARRTRFRG